MSHSTLANKIMLLSGQHIEASYCNNQGKGVPYLTGPSDFIAKIPVATKHTEHPKVSCEKGDVLITVKGSGTGSIAIADKKYCISRQLMAIRCSNDVSPNFVRYLLELNENHFNSLASGLIPGISRADVLNLKTPNLQLSEQTTIADLLSIWDVAIEKAERLISDKDKQKNSFMQSLLTCKRRINGFEKPWSEFHLGELFKERAERASGHLPLVSITRENGIIPRDEDRKDTSSEDKSSYLRICPGDIGYNTMRMWQGVSALSSLEGIVSPAYTICIPRKGVDGEFMAYLFKLPRTINLFYRHSQGLTSDTWNLKYKHFQEIKVSVPQIEEQKAIAKVLKGCDEEIDLLKKQAEAYRRQKRGLMQKLLTGEWRVKLNRGGENETSKK